MAGMLRRFAQVDVFAAEPYRGNPVAVVLDADGLDTATMARVARWTNLSETTFLLPPSEPGADYRVRIFTPVLELPFAGHPTLGTCHAWLAAGGTPQVQGTIVQQCAAGLITIRDVAGRRAFAAPPLLRSGAVDPATKAAVIDAFGLDPGAVVAAEWVDNGPGWLALLLDRPETVLAAKPHFVDLDVGLVAPYPAGSAAAIEVRAFFPKDGVMLEDPVTGSLNASLGQWLLGSGRLAAPYVAAQGTALDRAGRVHIAQDAAAHGDAPGQVWVGGDTVTCINGTIDL